MELRVKYIEVPKNPETTKIHFYDVAGQFFLQKEIPKFLQIPNFPTKLTWHGMDLRVKYSKVLKNPEIPKLPFYDVSGQFSF
jgi:hypothetical protein